MSETAGRIFSISQTEANHSPTLDEGRNSSGKRANANNLDTDRQRKGLDTAS